MRQFMQNTSYLKLLLNDSFVYEFETCNGFSESRALEVFLCMFKKNRFYKCTHKLYILNLSARAPSNSAVQGYNENFQGNHDFVYIANNMRCTCASITH